MSEKETEETTKKKTEKKEVKVSTGPWWKLSFRKNKVEKTAESEAEKSTEEKAAPEQEQTKPAKEPKGKRRSPQPKKEKTTSQVTPEKSEEEDSVEQDSSTDKAPQPKKRRSRGRRSRKPKQQEEAVKESKEEAQESAEKESRKTAKSQQQENQQEREEKEKTPKLKLLINAEEPEECRLALLEDGRLESIHVSTAAKEQRKNNIYKAKVVAVEPSLQAAFVDYGTEKNGFLPLGEIHPEYFKANISKEAQELVAKQQWKKLSIVDLVERGQEL